MTAWIGSRPKQRDQLRRLRLAIRQVGGRPTTRQPMDAQDFHEIYKELSAQRRKLGA